MAKLGFLGLGIMGRLMARNLLRAGHEVALWSHTPPKGRRTRTRAQWPVLRDSPRSRPVRRMHLSSALARQKCPSRRSSGRDGLIAAAKPGTVIADTSTVSPARSRAIGSRLAGRGIDFLDAPCTGSKPGAENGTLTFMVGGDRSVFERVRPWFEPMGKQLYYCGGPGTGAPRQADPEPNSIQLVAGIQRRHGALDQSRRRSPAHDRDPQQQRRPLRLDLLQGALCSRSQFRDKLLRKMDAQGHWAHDRLRKRSECTPAADRFDANKCSARRLLRDWAKRISVLQSRYWRRGLASR